jgi:hypothetical protein
MTVDNSNDNDQTDDQELGREPDAHGQAALLLVESLIHELIEQSLISVEQAIGVIQVAADVNLEIGQARGDSPDHIRRSLNLLDSISASLNIDLG